jgi:hypothetical protein
METAIKDAVTEAAVEREPRRESSMPKRRACEMTAAEMAAARAAMPAVAHPLSGGRSLGKRDLSSIHFIVGIENSAPSLTPDGQREVTVLVLV